MFTFVAVMYIIYAVVQSLYYCLLTAGLVDTNGGNEMTLWRFVKLFGWVAVGAPYYTFKLYRLYHTD